MRRFLSRCWFLSAFIPPPTTPSTIDRRRRHFGSLQAQMLFQSCRFGFLFYSLILWLWILKSSSLHDLSIRIMRLSKINQILPPPANQTPSFFQLSDCSYLDRANDGVRWLRFRSWFFTSLYFMNRPFFPFPDRIERVSSVRQGSLGHQSRDVSFSTNCPLGYSPLDQPIKAQWGFLKLWRLRG